MIASLPTPHLRALYDHLVVLWEKRAILPSWKWRELSPLPKVLENITINDIRPPNSHRNPPESMGKHHYPSHQTVLD